MKLGGLELPRKIDIKYHQKIKKLSEKKIPISLVNLLSNIKNQNFKNSSWTLVQFGTTEL